MKHQIQLYFSRNNKFNYIIRHTDSNINNIEAFQFSK